MNRYHLIVFALLMFCACGPKKLTWSRNSLHFKDASVELPVKLGSSANSRPSNSNSVYADGFAFHANYNRIDIYIMDAKLRKVGVPPASGTAVELLRGFATKHGMTLGKPTPFKSLASDDGLQLITSATKGSDEFGVLVHSASKGTRQVNIRIAWPKEDKDALNTVYRLSNSLSFK